MSAERWRQWRNDFARFLSGAYSDEYYLPFTVAYLRRFIELGEQQAARLAEAEELLRLTMRSPRAPYEKIVEFLDPAGPWPNVTCALLSAADSAEPRETDVATELPTCPCCGRPGLCQA